MVLLDIDRVPELMRVSRLTSYNRWNWAASTTVIISVIRPARSGNGSSSTRHATGSICPTIRLPADTPAVSRLLLQSGLVLLLLRSRRAAAGCPRRGEQHAGGTHRYWLRPDPASRTFRAAATKSLYVSPFMPVDLEYAFAFTPPAGRLVAHMETVRPARSALTRRCRSNDGPGARRRFAGRSFAIPR